METHLFTVERVAIEVSQELWIILALFMQILQSRLSVKKRYNNLTLVHRRGALLENTVR